MRVRSRFKFSTRVLSASPFSLSLSPSPLFNPSPFSSHQHMLERTRVPLLTIYYSSFRRLCTSAGGRSCALQFVTRLASAAPSNVLLLVTIHCIRTPDASHGAEITQWRENKRLAPKEIFDATVLSLVSIGEPVPAYSHLKTFIDIFILIYLFTR